MKRYGLITIILLTFYACSYDLMEKTIFIPDEKDGNLPAYTEWGYNSFGAKYERSYFVATNDIVPCKIVYRSGILDFSLSGRIGSGYYSGYYETGDLMLTFSFPSIPMKDYKDLTALNQREIDLTGASCIVKMSRSSQTDTLTVLSGHLTFKRVQLLRINDKEDRAILSGTFDLRFLRNELPETMSDGRFDLGITDLYVVRE